MKERPIRLKKHEVRGILDGRQSQVRRVLDPQPEGGVERAVCGVYINGNGNPLVCRHGQSGDRLWVRETHAIVPRTAYAQSTGVRQVLRPDDDHDAAIFREGWDRSPPGRWRPSIHMPRWASRITLEITGVRVERLQNISRYDAVAEGIQDLSTLDHADFGIPAVVNAQSPCRAFQLLWESINGAGSWDANPWVWVVEFDRLEVQ